MYVIVLYPGNKFEPETGWWSDWEIHELKLTLLQFSFEPTQIAFVLVLPFLIISVNNNKIYIINGSLRFVLELHIKYRIYDI